MGNETRLEGSLTIGPVRATHEALRRKGWKLSVAESCTGGLLGAAVTSVPGSSDVFRGGMIAYSNRVKRDCLDVSPSVLEESGAVSEPVARQMVEGVRRTFDTTIGVSITGIAGPAGGSDHKPVGLVYLGVSVGDDLVVNRNIFDGDRHDVRRSTVRTALECLLDSLPE